ncbi:hypothetical protein EMMF5_005550 [Cystobasidiomycetes sp. EMM_F5]
MSDTSDTHNSEPGFFDFSIFRFINKALTLSKAKIVLTVYEYAKPDSYATGSEVETGIYSVQNDHRCPSEQPRVEKSRNDEEACESHLVPIPPRADLADSEGEQGGQKRDDGEKVCAHDLG